MKRLFLILLFPLLLGSCEDVVDVNLKTEYIDLIAVEAYMNTKSSDNISVRINQSLPVNTTIKNPPVNEAIVEISDDQNPQNKIRLKEEGKSGVYKLPENLSYKVVPGRKYMLKITTVDGVVISGEDYVQRTEPIDALQINLSARGDYQFLGVFINTQEIPGPGNYYRWMMYKNGKPQNEVDELAFTSDDFFDGNYLYNFEIYTDFHDPDEPEDGVLQLGDTVYVEQHSISKNVYDFYFLLVNQAFTGNPFSVPPANLPGNLTADNGKKVMGLFSVSDVTVSNPVVIDSSNYTPVVITY